MEIAPTTNSFWGNLFGSAPASAPAPTPAPKSGGMVFNVGEGLNAAQTKTAYEKIATPDLATDNSFWGKLNSEFSRTNQPEDVRLPFTVNPTQSFAPPIIKQLGGLGFNMIEAIPRAAAIIGGEVANRFQPGEVKANIDLRRFGFEGPDYTTASKEVTDAINNGENPWQAGLRIASSRTLDVAFGAALVSDLAALSSNVLLKGGPQARIEAQNFMDTYKTNAQQTFQRLKEAPLDVREKAMAEITNTKNEAQKLLAEEGGPTAIDKARVGASRYLEVLSRQTPITKSFWSDFAKPNIGLKSPVSSASILDAKQLPGQRDVPGQAPAFGLSTRAVEDVGYGSADDFIKSNLHLLDTPSEIEAVSKGIKPISIQIASPSVVNLARGLNSIKVNIDGQDTLVLYKDPNEKVNAEKVAGLLKNGSNTPEYHTELGKLLGYSDKAISDFNSGATSNIPYNQTTAQLTDTYNKSKIQSKHTAAAVEEAAQRARMGQIFGMRPERVSSIPEAFRYDPYAKKVETIPTGETKIIKRTDKLEVTRNTLSALESKIGDPKNAPVDFKGNTLEDLQQKQVQLEAMKEAIDNNQLKNLEKYEAKSGPFKGELPEVLGKGAGDLKKSSLYKGYRDPNVLEFMRRGDYYIGEAGFSDSEEARSAYQQYKEAKEAYKSMVRNFSEDVKAYEGFYKGDVKSLSEAAKTHPITMEDLEPPTVRGDIKAPKLDFTKWKDKGVFRLNRDTFERNLDKVATPEDAKALKEFIVNPVRANELGRIKFTNNLKTALKTKLEGWNIKRNTLEDELIQKFGERQISLDELKKAAPKNWQQIQSAAGYFRNIYDDLLDTWNAERKAFGFAQIPKVPNYFRHFDDINFFVKNYGFLRSQDELPTEIAGKTEFFKPGKPFTTAELSRTGNSTKYSAIGGFNNYIDSVSKQIFHIDSVQRGRALEKYMENAAKLGKRLGEPLNLSNIMANIREYVNTGLAGKTATLDRAIESTIGRPKIRPFETLAKLIGKNIIVGNISTALSHLVTIPLNMATVGKIPLVKGAMTTLTSPFMKDAFTSIDGQESSFLVRRYPMEEIMPSKPKTAENALSYLFQVTDKFKTRMAVSSKYYEGISKGLSPEEAMKAADIYGGKLIGDYSVGQKPNIMNTKTFHLLAQFQLGLNDSISVLMHDIPHESGSGWKVASAYIQFAIYSYLFNLTLKQIRGAGKGIDPIDLGMTLTGLNDQGAGASFPKRVGLAGNDLAGELPFTSTFTGNFPLATALSQPVKDLMAGNYGKAAEGVLADFASPIGGGLQAKKTYEGAMAIKQGGVFNKSGQLEIPQGTSTMDKVQSLVFGKYASQAAQDYFDKAFIEAKAQAPIKKIYDQVQALKASGKTQEAQDIVDKLSDADYATYKTIRTNAKRADTLAAEKDMYATVQKVNTLKNAGKTDEAQAIVNDMTDAEYKIYQRVRDKGVSNANNTPSSSSSLSLGGRVAAYFSAATTDPIQTFHDIFHGQTIKGTKNGAILVDRMSLQESEAIKKSLLPAGGKASDYQLDHIIPLELGGTNEKSNLQLLTKAEDQANNDMENYLAKALGSKKISAKQAVQYMLDYKQGKLTAAEIKAGI